MIRPKIQFKGAKEIIGNIDALNGRLIVALETAVQEAGEHVAKDAPARLGPTPQGIRTGDYSKSFKSKFNKKDMTAKVGPVLNNRPHPLGHLIEFGTDPHMIPGFGGEHPGTNPVPHLFPAFEQEKQKFIKKVEQTIRDLA